MTMTALKWPILNTNDFETLVSNIDDINDINDLVNSFVNMELLKLKFKFLTRNTNTNKPLPGGGGAP